MADTKISALSALTQSGLDATNDILVVVDDSDKTMGVGGTNKKITAKELVGNSLQDLAQTWDDIGTNFSGLKLNVTDTASSAISKLIDLQIGGVSKFAVEKDGLAVIVKSIGSMDTLSYASSINLDLSAITGTYQTINLTGDITFTTSNRVSGRNVVIRLVCDSTNRNFTFPAGWIFVGTKPTSIVANKTGVLSIMLFGTTDNDAVCAYAEEA